MVGRWIHTLMVVAATSSLAACGSKSTSTEQSPTTKADPPSAEVPPGLDLRLSNGTSAAPPYDKAGTATVVKLPDADVAALLARAAPLATDPADVQAFALRPASQPAPRTGQTITATFPPPPSSLLPPPATDAGKDLRVLRYAPEGKVPVAPELSVTFSQPMVAVTSQGDAAGTVPVKLTPQPPGRWRWLGTRTVIFDPDVRFPQATTYKVEVPAGTKSTGAGGTLTAATTFTFETPPPTLVESWPSGGDPQRTDVPMLIVFDQKVDPRAVLEKIRVVAGGKTMFTSLLTPAEIEKDRTIADAIAAVKSDDRDGRWVAFRTRDRLPASASVDVVIPKGTPSAEGPNATTEEQRYTFRTYPPLAIREAKCTWNDEPCVPGQALPIQFTNPIDPTKFDPKLVTIKPDLPRAKIVHHGYTVAVHGDTKPGTTYAVTIDGALTDAFGQTLGETAMRTFTVGDARPRFDGPYAMVVLDPAAPARTYDLFTTNYDELDVKLYKVTPADLDAYTTFLENRWNQDKPPRVPGTQVLATRVKTGARNQLVETKVDLAKAITGKYGHAIAIVEPRPWMHDRRAPQQIAWLQATDLGVSAHVDRGELIAMVTELATGKPLAGVEVTDPSGTKRATTDATGLARIALNGAAAPMELLARRGDDVAILTMYEGMHRYQRQQRWEDTTALWFTADDRQLYRPGEKVSLKGWLRDEDNREGGDLGATTITQVRYVAKDARGNEIGKGELPVSDAGSFDLVLELPKTPNLGGASIVFSADGRRASHYHAIRIEEFRRPEFEVKAQPGAGPFVVGGGGDVTLTAAYFTGAPLPGAEVRWDVTAREGSFTPPNRDDYTFGTWTPWWGGEDGIGYRGGFDDELPFEPDPRRKDHWTLASKTDAGGEHVLHLDFLSANPPRTYSVTASGSVTDVNRQRWSSTSTLLVHPSSLYVGLRAKRSFVDKGVPFHVDVIGVDLDGALAKGAPIDVTAARLDWDYVNGKYVEKEVAPQRCAVTIATDAGACAFKTPEGGTYRITATIKDAQGRANTSTMTFWVSGGDVPPSRGVEQEVANLIPDKKEYTPGNTAEVLIQAPFHPAEGLVTWRRSGIVKTERITLDGPTKVITVPITDELVPNVYVAVDLVGTSPRVGADGKPDPKLPRRPAYARGSLRLAVPPTQRALRVVATPAAPRVSPAEKTSLTVEVHDAAGAAVANAEVAVFVVDEAILSLTGHTFGDPLDTFYRGRPANAWDYHSRKDVKLAKLGQPVMHDRDGDGAEEESGGSGATMELEEGKLGRAEAPGQMARAAPAPKAARGYAADEARNAGVLGSVGGDAFGGEEPTTPIAVRSNFDPLAAFVAAAKTDGSGKVTVPVVMPDNLTRYRVVAYAASGAKQFGKGESAITARLPLMVRPSPPRFLNFGDVFALPVVVHNQTDAPMQVKLAVRTSNLTLSDGAGRGVTVPANDRVEVLFPAAAEMAGTARLQILASSPTASDAAELSLPVWTPATTEAFATYGVIDDGAIAQPVALPGQVVTSFGGLDITAASTNLQAVTDALLYLVHYPYECAEQRASRILAIAALRDVLEAFQTKDMPSRTEIERSVAKDLERLTQMQNADGGFAWWERGYPSDPFLSIHVTNALVRARGKGYAVPSSMYDRAVAYLRVIEKHFEPLWPKEVQWSISAYALYVRKLAGDLDVAKAKSLFAEAGADKLPIEAHAWLLGTLAKQPGAATERAAIVRHALNRVTETAGAANFTTRYDDGAHLLLASDRRVDAIFLESLIQEQPALDLIPKLVTGLLGHRKAGRWLNTQENSFALLALDRYFQTYEKATPNFVARVWLGAAYAGDLAFRGRSTKQLQIAIPMKDVATHDKQALTIQKDGPGRLYYRIGMRYAPSSLKLEPADYGFVVARTYEGIDDPKDVTRDASGTWHIKAGARVRIKLSMANENRRYHVALVDPLPAGLEPMNPALATTGPLPRSTIKPANDRYGWWSRPWYEHQNLRDERVEAFASMLWEGVHAYEYVARATTPGTFVVPPPKAEEMYMPETFGRGASDRVIVE